ncbi:MAG TPA: hypothetical protein VD967_01005 [Candidatus Paceibacterota bacterium]|nr:hypothetical protein [Candidatus Paceibacterota bacterium]
MQALVDKFAAAIINPLLLLMFAAAFLYFVYGIFQFVRNPEDSGARSKGIQHMVYGLIGLLLMVTAGAVFNIIKATVNSLR